MNISIGKTTTGGENQFCRKSLKRKSCIENDSQNLYSLDLCNLCKHPTFLPTAALPETLELFFSDLLWTRTSGFPRTSWIFSQWTLLDLDFVVSISLCSQWGWNYMCVGKKTSMILAWSMECKRILNIKNKNKLRERKIFLFGSQNSNTHSCKTMTGA